MINTVLETERLILRPLQADDAPAITRYAGDRRIAAGKLSIPHPLPQDWARRYIDYHRQAIAAREDYCLALTRRPDPQLIGIINLYPQTANGAQVGFWTGLPFWGQGYMSEALRAVLRFAFQDLALPRVHASHFGSNPASGRVMQKAGMRREGCLRQHLLKDGVPQDLVCHGMLRADYEANHA
ncbi:MAG: GNAT family N-acetyltransferase [Anaerolineaceae bacterium]|nr:GNAT family N-acetyltransferase [Anaerolineaceae bacterium]